MTDDIGDEAGASSHGREVRGSSRLSPRDAHALVQRPSDRVLVAEQCGGRSGARQHSMARHLAAAPTAGADRRSLYRQRRHAELTVVNRELKMWPSHGRTVAWGAKSAN